MNPDPPALWQREWFQWLVVVLVALAVASMIVPSLLGLVYAIRPVLLPVVVALSLAYIVNPLIGWVERRLRLPRWASTAGIMLALLVVLTILSLLIVPPLAKQGADLVIRLQKYPTQLLDLIQDKPANGPNSSSEPDPTPAQDNAQSGEGSTTENEQPSATALTPETAFEPPSSVNEMIDRLRDPVFLRSVLARALDYVDEISWQSVANFLYRSLDLGVGVGVSAINTTSYLLVATVIVAFCFFFFSWKFERLLAWFVPYIPAAHRARTLELLDKMDASVAAFIRGRLLQVLVMIVVLSVGWWWAGVPFWLLLGVLSGLLNLVPFAAVVGWLVAILLTSIDAMAGGDGFTLSVIIWPTVVYVVAQALDGWVVEPLVQGKATDLDPVTVLLVVMVGAALAGLLGMLLAIPTAACIKILAKEVFLPWLRALAAESEPAASVP